MWLSCFFFVVLWLSQTLDTNMNWHDGSFAYGIGVWRWFKLCDGSVAGLLGFFTGSLFECWTLPNTWPITKYSKGSNPTILLAFIVASFLRHLFYSLCCIFAWIFFILLYVLLSGWGGSVPNAGFLLASICEEIPW